LDKAFWEKFGFFPLFSRDENVHAFILDPESGPAHYIKPARKSDKISVSKIYLGGEYGKHEIATADGLFYTH
jgi:hypothetical protein